LIRNYIVSTEIRCPECETNHPHLEQNPKKIGQSIVFLCPECEKRLLITYQVGSPELHQEDDIDTYIIEILPEPEDRKKRAFFLKYTRQTRGQKRNRSRDDKRKSLLYFYTKERFAYLSYDIECPNCKNTHPHLIPKLKRDLQEIIFHCLKCEKRIMVTFWKNNEITGEVYDTELLPKLEKRKTKKATSGQ